jgi:hypothetical protein
MATLKTLAVNCILSALQPHHDKTQRASFFQKIPNIHISKEGRTTKLVEEPEIQKALAVGCTSPQDVVILAAYDILLQESVDEYCARSGSYSLEERILTEKAAMQASSQISGFGSSTTSNLLFAKTPNANTFGSLSVDGSYQSGSSSAASPFGIGAPPSQSSIVSFGFTAQPKIEQPSASSLFAVASPFGISVPPASSGAAPFGFSGDPKAQPPTPFAGFASDLMPALTEIDFANVASSQPTSSRRPMAKKSNLRKK